MPIFTAAPLPHFLAVSVILFALGVFTLLTRKNAVALLMGIELVMNAATLNFVAFARYSDVFDGVIEGPLFALFVIIVAAAEAAVAFAIIIGIYRNFRSIDVDETDFLKE